MSDSYPWEHMLERAHTNGLLGKQLFVVSTTPIAVMEPIQANIKEQLAYSAHARGYRGDVCRRPGGR